MKKLKEYLKVGEAADYVGVTANTLRNWEVSGHISVYRNPLNNYRLYEKEELDRILDNVKDV